MPEQSEDVLEADDPRSMAEILASMVERVTTGFEAASRAMATLEETLIDVADAMEALDSRLAALEGKDGCCKSQKEPVSPYDASAQRTSKRVGRSR